MRRRFRRAFNGAAAVSAVLFLTVTALWIWSYLANVAPFDFGQHDRYRLGVEKGRLFAGSFVLLELPPDQATTAQWFHSRPDMGCAGPSGSRYPDPSVVCTAAGRLGGGCGMQHSGGGRSVGEGFVPDVIGGLEPTGVEPLQQACTVGSFGFTWRDVC